MSNIPAQRDAPVPRGGDISPPASPELFRLIASITRLRDARLDKALKPLGLNVTRCQAITVIARLEPCTMSQLADLSGIDRTTLTRIVDQLVARALAQRATRSQDRRQVVLTLTPKGRAVRQGALEAIDAVDRAALMGLPQEVLAAVARANRAIAANLAPDVQAARRPRNPRRD